MVSKPQIAIVDFGSQYTHLIARRIRQLGVLAKIYPPMVKVNQLRGLRGVILSGGPQSVYDKTAIRFNQKILDAAVPVLGLCYGHQLLVHYYGGIVKPGKVKEYGLARLRRQEVSRLLVGLKNNRPVWMSHGDTATRLPAGFSQIGSTGDCRYAAIADEKRRRYGLQFHPEVTHTEQGLVILKNFVFGICHCRRDWSMKQYLAQLTAAVRKTVGNRRVFLLVSGGVDSSVAFAILEKVLGKKRVFGLHIDNGFMRLNESVQVKTDLAKAGFDNLVTVDASNQFLKAVAGVTDPEKKREIIGQTFLRVKDAVMRREGLNKKHWILGQGTIYPDTIETGGTKNADKIKTHHNRVAAVLRLMKLGGLVEPLVDLYKDEVRELGRILKLPNSLLDRQPFPGPGLAIRALCNTGKSQIKGEKKINQKIKNIIGKKFNGFVLPIQSVGVQGDNRTYRHPVLLAGRGSWQTIGRMSVVLTNKVRESNRVVYLLLPIKVRSDQFKLKKSFLTKQRLDLLRQVDAVVRQFTKANKLDQKIWQFPVILAPLTLGGGETIILRPVESAEAMTVNFYPMSQPLLTALVKKIMTIKGIDAILFDVTNKPPATIEWE